MGRSVAPAWEADLGDTGRRHLSALLPLVNLADPEGRVLPRSRVLCAALGRLAELSFEALGGEPRSKAQLLAGRMGAMLALVTKIDDEVIDSAAFHGGFRTPRAALRTRTEAFLAPTLQSILDGRPANGEPRCLLAAELGALLRETARSPRRRDQLLGIIERGWAVQVEAVALLTSHPAEVSRLRIEAVTASISGLWLLMITACGALPRGAARALSWEEEHAFMSYGAAIQRADALADLGKDVVEGLVSTYVGRLAWERAGETYVRAAARRDLPEIYRLVARHRVDVDALPASGAPDDAGALALLGRVPALLGWIHQHLLRRYLEHPLCAYGRGHASVERRGEACSGP